MTSLFTTVVVLTIQIPRLHCPPDCVDQDGSRVSQDVLRLGIGCFDPGTIFMCTNSWVEEKFFPANCSKWQVYRKKIKLLGVTSTKTSIRAVGKWYCAIRGETQRWTERPIIMSSGTLHGKPNCLFEFCDAVLKIFEAVEKDEISVVGWPNWVISVPLQWSKSERLLIVTHRFILFLVVWRTYAGWKELKS